jgi:hypothetical protein
LPRISNYGLIEHPSWEGSSCNGLWRFKIDFSFFSFSVFLWCLFQYSFFALMYSSFFSFFNFLFFGFALPIGTPCTHKVELYLPSISYSKKNWKNEKGVETTHRWGRGWCSGREQSACSEVDWLRLRHAQLRSGSS